MGVFRYEYIYVCLLGCVGLLRAFLGIMQGKSHLLLLRRKKQKNKANPSQAKTKELKGVFGAFLAKITPKGSGKVRKEAEKL